MFLRKNEARRKLFWRRMRTKVEARSIYDAQPRRNVETTRVCCPAQNE